MRGPRVLAFIPARSGSKGLADKNIKPLAGKPLLAHTIQAAVESGLFQEVFLSTDSRRYADIGLEYGASVPFLRDPALATDTASTWSAIRSGLEQYKEIGRDFDTVVLLQPTSPLRTAADIRGAYELFQRHNARGVVSVCETDHSPLWCGTLPADGSLEGFISPEVRRLPRQQLDRYYRINGAVYIFRVNQLADDGMDLYTEGCYAYVMPKERSLDIDDILDFRICEVLLEGSSTLSLPACE